VCRNEVINKIYVNFSSVFCSLETIYIIVFRCSNRGNGLAVNRINWNDYYYCILYRAKHIDDNIPTLAETEPSAMTVSTVPCCRTTLIPRIYRTNPSISKRSSITSISRRIRFLPLTPLTRATKLPSDITFVMTELAMMFRRFHRINTLIDSV